MVNDVFGTDINSDWNFIDGDIELSSGEDNIGQSIYNRLLTDDDWYADFYIRYGGKLYEHFGDFNHPNIHEYIKIDVESILSQDPRIQNIDCAVNKISRKEVEIKLNLTIFGSDEVIPLNLIINDDGGVFIYPSELNDRRL